MEYQVNIGCGATPTTGWVNFDNSASVRLVEHPFITRCLKALGILDENQLSFINMAGEKGIHWADASKQIPLQSDSVDVLYSSHMLEHLKAHQVLSFLREAHRVLRIGGILRIVVPDLKLLVQGYLDDGDANRFVSRLQMTTDAPRSFSAKVKFLLIGERQHQWQYDGVSLCKLLSANGFSEAAVLEPGETTIQDPGALDLYERAEESVYVEVRKA